MIENLATCSDSGGTFAKPRARTDPFSHAHAPADTRDTTLFHTMVSTTNAASAVATPNERSVRLSFFRAN